MLFYPHIKNIAHRGLCLTHCAYAAGTLQLPLIDRDVTREPAGDSPCLTQPPLALDARDTNGHCYATSLSTYDAPCTNARRESSRARAPVQPASCHMHSARGGSLRLLGGASHDERERLATDLDVACKITCTALHYDGSHLSGWSSYFATEKRAPAPTSCPRDCRYRRLASLPTTTSTPTLRCHAQASFLHCTHFCTGCPQHLISSWVPTTTGKYSMLGALYHAPRRDRGGFTALHKRTTARPKHRSTSGSPLLL